MPILLQARAASGELEHSAVWKTFCQTPARSMSANAGYDNYAGFLDSLDEFSIY
jgi:hypothetical protein